LLNGKLAPNRLNVYNPCLNFQNTPETMLSIPNQIATELSVQAKQVTAAVALLDEGSTVPFISRYRKEVTGGLDDGQLRTLEERLNYLRDLEDRRQTVLKAIDEQGKLAPELKQSILSADTKTRLEDLYAPYKKKRRTKGQIAIEAGIEPLADGLFTNPDLDPMAEAASYCHSEGELADTFGDAKSVLDGAKFILMERFADDADLKAGLREMVTKKGKLISVMASGKEEEGAKFRDYFDNRDSINDAPSHRVLAMLRGQKEGILHLKVDVELEDGTPHPAESMIAQHTGVANQGRPADAWLGEVVGWTWRIKLQLSLELELLGEMRRRAEAVAIDVFGNNLKDLLMAAPAGPKATMGLDPGLRTGVKIAVVDATGRYLESTAIFPHVPRKQWDESIATLAKLAKKHDVRLLAIGNGTASRETDSLCADLIKRHPELKLQKVIVSEAGASVYSASESAAREFPELDVTVRGAISIAHRLQDPLAELVKIDPKSIGVGQYQHDVNQMQLARNLDTVVEDCVNSVGVDLNTASSALLSHVSGLSQTVADNIVEFRDSNGRFRSRKQLSKVPRLGGKTFEQAAGFLRIHDGDNPLDGSAVHPESYVVVEHISKDAGVETERLIGNTVALRKLDPQNYVNDQFGLPTVTDIISELDKPGRDPRPVFKTATFKDGVEKLSDLKPGMILEGVVTNVTNFGAFVDIGVHQDGLVHISALANRFVKDPREVVKAGDIVSVRVVELDEKRRRIALSMRLEDAPEKPTQRPQKTYSKKSVEKVQREPMRPGSLAEAFKRFGK
jgi:uncharacterized protein